MREDRGYELRVVSHIVLVVAVTIFSLILIGLDLYLGWDRWTIPLFITAMLVCPAIHIFNVSDEGFRLYVYSIVMFVEIFYYIMHAESLYDATPILMLAFALLAMTQNRRLIIICIAVGVAGIMVRVIAYYDAIGANAQITDVIKLIWNSLLVIVTGLTVVRMLRISEESRIFYGELIRTLEQETKRADLFLANVSNEIKTPVDEIIGLADGALAAGKGDMIADRLSGISFEGRRVAHQIGDMLDYSELEMGKTVVTERDYSISSILDDMVMELKIYKETGTELVIDVDPSLPSVMISDPDKLEKILFHIIFNALKYTERGGVYVRISHMPREYGVNLNIDVTDTGIGMDEEEVEKIYDRFYKADTGRKGDQSGLGLGMSIVEGFVNALEGFVIVNSIPGEGTRVHVSIPQKVADASKCMSVENADQLEVGLYLQFDRFPDPQVREFYNEMMRNMAQGLELKVYRVDNEKDLRMLIKTHALTHLFVGELQYASDPVYMEELARTLKLVIVCDSGYEIAGRTGAILLRKPFYCFPVMSILQNEPEEDIQAEDIKTETGPEFTGEAAAEEKENEGFAILRRAGIDPAKGMGWCLNDTEVYTAVLLEFASDVREKQKELDSFFEAADWENFMIRVHAVKSSANTIGASGLSESAKKLEKAARENDSRYIGSEYPDFMQEYLETLEAINRAYGADKSCPSAAPDEDTPAKGASG